MARDREQAVVLGRVEPHGARADRRHEALDEIDARVVRDGRRGEEPDGAVEEIGARASGPAGCAAREGMARDEARILDGGEHALRRADVGDGRLGCGGERVAHGGDDGADGHRDDDEVRAGDRVRERGRAVDGGLAQHRRIGVPAAHAGDACPARRERDGGAEEPGADDREPRDRRGRARRRGGRLAGVARLLLHHVEDGGEEGAHALLAEWACIRPDELVEELGLARGVDERRAGLLLVRADTPHELEPAVERSKHLAVDGRNLVAQVREILVHRLENVRGGDVRRMKIAPFLVLALALVGSASAAASPAPSAHGQLLRLARANTNQSSNWFGYNQGTLEQGTKQFNSITGDWTVPAATQHTAGQDEYSSDWIGIGGGCVDAGCTVTDNTLIQTGTEQDVSGGQATYGAWWEIIPGPSVSISMTIAAGDHMHSSIAEAVAGSNVWTITLQDVTRNETFTTTVPYSSTHLTAEWIEETPLILGTNAGFAALPNLTSPVFDNATTNGAPANLKSSEQMQLIDSNSNVIGTASAPDPDGDGFNACTWATSCAAPSSS